MVKKLLLTFDYELFLGQKSGRVNDCLIRPTSRLLEIMESAGLKSVFFVDTVYLLRLKKQAETVKACMNDFLEITEQIQEIIRRKNYVFPHVHPHWLDAVYLPEINEWQLSNISRYRFHNISEKDRSIVFDGSMAILREIIEPVAPAYELNAHRAGGWSIQPFADFLPFYLKHNIKYDFSVLDSFYMFTNAQYFDFSDIPSKMIYRFGDELTTESVDGRFTEFVNSTHKISPLIKFFDRLLLKWLYKVANDYSYGRGMGQSAKRVIDKPKKEKGFDMTDPQHQYLSVELLSFLKIRMYLSFMRNHDFMHFVSHPKMVTQHNLNTFRSFVKKIKGEFEIETDFKKMI